MLKLRRFLKPHMTETIIGSLLKLLEAFFELLLPYYMIKIVDIGLENRNIKYIWESAGKMLIFAILGLISVFICQKLAANVSCNVATDIRKELMEKISSLSYDQLDSLGTSSLVNRLTVDVNMVRDAVAFLIRLVTRAPFLCIGAIVMGLMVDKKTTIIFIVIIPIFSLFLFFISKKIIPYQKTMQKKLDELGLQLRENLSGIRVIRAFVRQETERKKVSKTIDDLSNVYIKLNNYKNLINPITILVLNVAIIFILYWGGFRVFEGTLSRSQILALIQYITQIMFALIIISNLVTLFTQASASAERINEVLNLKKDMEYKQDLNKKNMDTNKPVEFKNVSFAYVSDKNSIDDVSFTLKKGKVLGIIGPTGAGKTTLINLIGRFYDVTKGSVYYNNINVKEYPKDRLLKDISIVSQKSVLFSGTIAENMRYVKKDATPAEIWDALSAAQASEFVKKLNNGIGSRVERGGTNFSGGQRQRLAIARGLIKNPRLLILDDSLSALDYHTDMLLRKALKTYYKSTTVIIVSQRVSSVMTADNIIVMEDGKIKEEGNHEKLINKAGIYHEIFKTQFEKEGLNNG